MYITKVTIKVGGLNWRRMAPFYLISDPGYSSGNLLPNAPKFNANGWLNFEPCYTLDAALGFKHNAAGIRINVMNITNQSSYLNPWQFNLFDVRPLRQFVLT